MNLKQSLTVPAQDPKIAKKLLTAVLLCIFSLFLLPYFALQGYYLDVTRAASRGNDEALPEYDNWGGNILGGFLICLLATLYWIVPISLTVIGFGGFLMSLLFGAGASYQVDSIVPLLGGIALGGTVALGFGAVGCLLGFAASLVWPGVYMRYAVTRNFASAFNPAVILKDLLVAPKDYCLIYLSVIVVYIFSSTLTAVTSGLALVVLAPLTLYAWFAQGHLMGQYWRTHFSDDI